jgi:hypothetical protein
MGRRATQPCERLHYGWLLMHIVRMGRPIRFSPDFRNRADNGNVTRPSSQVPEKPALVAAEETNMCDYSLHHVMSRPAAVGDKLVSTTFPGTITRGFAPQGDPNTAICLLPGTEIAFEDEIRYYEEVTHFPTRKGSKVARFRQVDLDNAYAHHDALEFPDGQIVLVTRLCEGQHGTVLQLPAAARPAEARTAETPAAPAEPVSLP